MPEPYNYTIQQPNLSASFAQGLQLGEAEKSRMMEQQKIDFAEKQRLQAIEQQKAMQSDLSNVYTNPTAANISQAILKYPHLSAQYKPVLDGMNEKEKANRISQASSVYSALKSGRKDIAIQQLKQYEEAERNSGNVPSANALKGLRLLAESEETGKVGDKLLESQTGMMLASALGPTEFMKWFPEERAQAEAPAELKKKEADAEKAAVAARFAESDAVADLAKKGWDITKIKNDIDVSKQNTKIAAMNASLARESVGLQRQKLALDIEEAVRKRDETVRNKSAEGESAMATITDSTSLLSDILADEDTLRAAVGKSAWRGSIPGSKSRTMAGKLSRLENIIASANLDKLKGAMSDKDIVFLKNIGTNLDKYQNEDDFVSELTRIMGSLDSAGERVSKKTGIPYAPKGKSPAEQNKYSSVDEILSLLKGPQ